ncbi:hypothetical protein C1646_764832 [Rhizophagus diaphanus]|nr:hypothetical protein C1646_764832 [Rhizophagus diaphanus] [Rhizophagus sp. MUCL 43196]
MQMARRLISEKYPYILSIRYAYLQENIIQSLTKGENNLKNFFQNVEQLRAVLAHARRAVQAIEANASNIASIFMELIKMAVAIKQISNYLDLDFKKKCISIFNKRWV